MYCLETSNLIHRYSNREIALDGVNMHVPAGSIYGFLGPNGAGKTTTLRLLLGLLKRQQGNISIFGRTFEQHRVEILASVGSMIENPSSYDHLTASENLSVLQRIHRCPTPRIPEVLALVGLSGTQRKKVRQFSLGMKQRLGIAMALLHRPKFLILDEPTNGLDANGMVEIRQLLVRLSREDGITILLSSHLLAEIEKLATHVGIIGDGRMRFEGTMTQLRQQQQTTASLHVRTTNDQRALKIMAGIGMAGVVDENGIVLPAMADDRMAAMNRQLIDAGVDVYSLSSRGHDLESIYLAMVGYAA
ncbi:ATP-binding cassette domain-containing protein [Rhodanobacter sp. L36]|uniref:ATP-binding cassette domain-containing protein n=1 Tax=Rhodanobacter sp. L36 TaxID=1747221 RepID=UPI00131C67CA|nr:ATP-binding cassette domain-containing protein [Rhodanobacter sp. L36]